MSSLRSTNFAESLPIDTVLGDVRRILAAQSIAVLVAPPGAGKTTRLPLALLGEPWLNGKKILVLEPRRLAARAAAERMARSLRERVGEIVGLRARLDSRVGPKTRIEVITEGVFTRLILDGPDLADTGAILFDEFHERALDADQGLAFALETQRELRPDLRLLVMSATLEDRRIAELLGGAPIVRSDGRTFPVETNYLGRRASTRIEERMTDAILRTLRNEHGSILAFLPGRSEINRVALRLANSLADPSVIVAPLYGALDMAAQERAIEPAPPGRRKVVLATSIAETSLTIEGVRIVIDSGLSRVPRYETDAGVTRLETVRVPRSSADQRRGRAGRTEAGICYRLWDEPETASLPPFNEPEIRSADLSGLVLDCAEWGVREPRTRAWLDPPTAPALEAARGDLVELGAVDRDGRITEVGRRIRALPLPPRLASMVLKAAEHGAAKEAAEIAAVLVERGLGGTGTDLEQRIESFRRDRSRRAEAMRSLTQSWARAAAKRSTMIAAASAVRPSLPALLALAYPSRIAKARGAQGQFLLANSRGALVDETDRLARARYLVVAELQGKAAATRILLAVEADEEEILGIARDRIEEKDEAYFDRAAAQVRARRVRRLGAIELGSEPRPVAPGPDTARALAEGIASLGIDGLPWTKAQRQLRDRVQFVRSAGGGDWPDLGDAALAANVSEWLAPFLAGKTRLAEITPDDLDGPLEALLPWHMRRRLDAEAPTHFEAPTGNRHAIDYDSEGAPALRIRVQELFGLKAHPAIANGKLPLTLHLLSPAQRPIQITRDLPRFWAGSWAAVRLEMKGRYPRHAWPDDPANATPTSKAKPKGT
jgi:ATP-dependent helicase HrpB